MSGASRPTTSAGPDRDGAALAQRWGAPDLAADRGQRGRCLGPQQSASDDDGTLIRPDCDFTKAEEEPVDPGAVERYDITMDPVFAHIESGHRLRLSPRTNSSWATPFAKDMADVVGTYQVQRTGDHAPHVNGPFVSGPLPGSGTTWGDCSTNCGSSHGED